MLRTVRNRAFPVCQPHFAQLYHPVTALSSSLFVSRTAFYCLFAYVLVSALLQSDMCVGSSANTDLFFDGHDVLSDGFDPSTIGERIGPKRCKGWLAQIQEELYNLYHKRFEIKKGIKKAIKTLTQDGFTISGFKSSRTSEFENE